MLNFSIGAKIVKECEFYIIAFLNIWLGVLTFFEIITTYKSIG